MGENLVCIVKDQWNGSEWLRIDTYTEFTVAITSIEKNTNMNRNSSIEIHINKTDAIEIVNALTNHFKLNKKRW